MADLQQDVRRVEKATRAEIDSSLKTKMIGIVNDSNPALAFKKTDGTTEYITADGGDKVVNSLKIEGLAGNVGIIGVDILGNIVPVEGATSEGAENAVQVAGAAAGTFKDSGIKTNVNIMFTKSLTVKSDYDLSEASLGSFSDGQGAIELRTSTGESGIFSLASGGSAFNSQKKIAHPAGTLPEHSATLAQTLPAYGVVSAAKQSAGVSPFTKATRTFTILGGWVVRVKWDDVILGSLSVVVPNVAGDYIIYYEIATGTLKTSLTMPVWDIGFPVARVVYSTVAGDEISMAWENHGVRTLNDWNEASGDHHTTGTLGALGATPVLIDGGRNTSVLGLNGGTIWDEDKKSSVGSKASDGTAVWAKFYYNGLTAGANKLERFPADFGTATPTQLRKIWASDVDLGVGATGRACINFWNGTQYVPQAIGASAVMLIHVLANDGILDNSAIKLGDTEYTGSNLNQSIQNARAGAGAEIARVKSNEASARDALYVGSIIINASGLKQWVDDANTTTVLSPSVAGVSGGGSIVDTLTAVITASGATGAGGLVITNAGNAVVASDLATLGQVNDRISKTDTVAQNVASPLSVLRATTYNTQSGMTFQIGSSNENAVNNNNPYKWEFADKGLASAAGHWLEVGYWERLGVAPTRTAAFYKTEFYTDTVIRIGAPTANILSYPSNAATIETVPSCPVGSLPTSTVAPAITDSIAVVLGKLNTVVSRQLYKMYSAVALTNPTTATSLFSGTAIGSSTIPNFSVAGKVYTVKCGGIIVRGVSTTVTLQTTRATSTNLGNFTVAAGTSTEYWSLQSTIIVTGTNTCAASAVLTITSGAQTYRLASASSDSAASSALFVSASFGTSNAGNSITCDYATIEEC